MFRTQAARRRDQYIRGLFVDTRNDLSTHTAICMRFMHNQQSHRAANGFQNGVHIQGFDRPQVNHFGLDALL